MNKKNYKEPEMEIIVFENEDVIIASPIVTPEDILGEEYKMLFQGE